MFTFSARALGSIHDFAIAVNEVKFSSYRRPFCTKP